MEPKDGLEPKDQGSARDLWIAIPAYNCATQIPRLISQLEDQSIDLSRVAGLTVYDNRSQDDTFEVAKRAIEALRSRRPLDTQALKMDVVRNPQNLGLGGTHKVAIKKCGQAQVPFCLVLHGDDQARIRDFATILSKHSYQKPKHTFGSRFSFHSKRVNYSTLRTLGNFAINCFVSTLFLRVVPDLGGSGLNIYNLELLEERYLAYADDLTFHVDLLLDALNRRQHVEWEPIQWIESDQVSTAKVFRQGFKVLAKIISARIL